MKRFITFLILPLVPFAAILSQPTQQPHALSLADCRQMALEHNEQARTADNAVRQAELDRQIAFASYLPKVDGSLTGAYLKDMDMMDFKLQMRGVYLAGLNITQPIYAGGQITAANRLAAIGQHVSEEQRRQIRMQILADVDKAYYSLIAVQAKVQMLEAYAAQMQGLYDQVSLSVSAQMATQNDLLRISTKQNEIAYQLQKARNGHELCRLSLANIIGADFDAPLALADTVPYAAVTQQPLTDNFANRPELHLLEMQVEATQQQVKMARANYLPTIGLSLGYSYYDNIKLKGTTLLDDGTPYAFKETFSGNSPMALLSVSIPLFHWGAEFKKVKKAKLDVDNARLQLQQNQRGMRIEVRQAIQNISDGRRMVETALTGRQQAEENLRQLRQRYDAQMATMTDLLDAQSQWQQARSNLIEAQTQLCIYMTEYQRVTGTLE